MKTTRFLNPLSVVTLAVGLIPASSHAASATWNATPTNGSWEAAGTENNWSTGAATFPGALNATTNTDVATFLTSNTTTIAINSSGGNSSPLGIGGMIFGVSGSTPSAFTIGNAGANGGNSLLLDSGSNITFASGSTGTITQIVNAPLVLQPASGILAGTYQFVNSAASTSALQINGNVSGGTTTQGITLTLSGTNANAGNVLSGVISNGVAVGNLSITKANSGTWAITGTNNSFTGGLRVEQGTLNVSTISNTGSNSSIGSGGGLVFVAGGSGNATLNINGAGGETNRAITFNNNTGGVNHAIISSNGSGPVVLTGNITPGTVGNTTAATFELGGGNLGANIVSGAITDNAARVTSIIKSGSGTWTLSGTSNTYAGSTTVSTGILAGVGPNAFGNTSGISIAGAGTLSLRGNSDTTFVKASDNATRYAVTTSGSDSTINVDQATGAGTGAKTMTIGTLTASNAASYLLNFSGANNTSLSAGAMTGSASGSAATNTIANAIAGGGSLTLASYTSANTVGGDTLTFSGVGNTTVTGAVTPSATILNLRQNGTGVVTLNGTSNYTGITTVSTGTLVVGANAPNGSSGALGNATSEVVLGTAGGSTDAALLIGGAFTVGRDIRTPTNNTTDAGTRVLTLGGNTAGNSIFAGTITLGTANQAGRGVTLTAANGGQVTFSGVIQNPNGMDATAYTVTKSGLGSVVLSNTNTYSGATKVSEGTLAVSSTGSLAAGSAVTVQTGATLDVAGTINGAITVDSGGTLKGNGGLFNASVTIQGIHSPGASPGIQTFTSGISYGATSTLNAEFVGDSLGLRGTDYDGIDVTGGNLTIAPLAIFKLIGTNIDYGVALWDVDRSFNIIDFSGAGASTGVFVLDTSSAGSFAGQGSWGLSNTDKDIVLNWVAIPEPNVASMIGGIGVIALLRRRRHSP